jgi:superfamily II DNA or RNA helicase
LVERFLKMTRTETKPPAKAVLRERVYVPCESVTDEMLEAWTYLVPDPEDKDNKIEVLLYRDMGRVFSFARGDMGKVKKFFGKGSGFKVKDRRVCPPMEHPITMRTELFTPETDSQGRNQQEVAAKWLASGYGQIKAPARFGKTITVSDIMCTLGKKTLILSHQWDILDQFEKTIREHTDIEDVEKMAGRKLVGRLDEVGWDKLESLDIVLSSWQSWWHESKRHYLKKYRDTFGIIFVDESHLSQATCYAKVVDAFNAKYRCGNTATPFKLNELHVIIENILGPVIANGHSRQMHCSVEYIYTDCIVEKFSAWTSLLSNLVKDEKRNELIIEEAVRDASAGRYVLITTERTAHAKELSDAIAEKGITSTFVVGGTHNRDAIYERCRKGEIQVLVAMRRITRLGIDVPLWDTFYNILPTSDPHNFYQELSRIRTHYDGKPEPLIKDFVDDPVREAKGAIMGTLRKRNEVYLEQEFNVKNASVRPKKDKRLKWGRKTRKSE